MAKAQEKIKENDSDSTLSKCLHKSVYQAGYDFLIETT